MNFLSAHPVTIVLALISMVIWTTGNRNQNKKLVWVGIAFSVAATVTFFLGL